MALKKCKECGNPVSTKAKHCPQCGAVKGKEVGCLGYLVACGFIVFVVFSLINSDSETPSSTPDREQFTDADEILTTKEPKTAWSYRESEYDMGKGRVYQAINQSTNTANFSFPYSGAQHATLILRTHPKHGKDLIFQIEKGQILSSSYDGSKVLVRFDDGEPVKFKVMPPADHGSTSVFIQDYYGFVKKMLKAKRVRISANVYKEGSPMFEFDVSGFSQQDYLGSR